MYDLFAYNIVMVLVGGLGMLIGKQVDLEKSFSKWKVSSLGKIFLGLVMIVFFWLVYRYEVYWSLLFIATLILFYFGYLVQKKNNYIKKIAVFLGNHSLFIYIFHIIVLKIFSESMPTFKTGSMPLLLFYALIFSATIYLITSNVIYLTKKSSKINRLYATIF